MPILRRLTTQIVQSDPELFDDSGKRVTVVYRAQTPVKSAYMLKAIRGGIDDTSVENVTANLKRLKFLCELALCGNVFIGMKWVSLIDSGNDYSELQMLAQHVYVTVQPPSAHERAESLLSVFDWLEDKVSETKRRKLLGLDAE